MRGGLVADALHHVAVGGDHPGAVIHQRAAEPRRQQPLGERHADRGGDALAERAGGGLDRRVLAVFGMAGGGGVELAEALDLLDPHAVVAGEVEQRVQQHRAVAGGQHEPVAVRPARVGGIELVEAGPQRGGDIGHAHRHAGMAGFRRLHRVDRQRADGVGHLPGLAWAAGPGSPPGGRARGCR